MLQPQGVNKSENVVLQREALFSRKAAMVNASKVELSGFARFSGVSGQNLAGSGALVFEGELLEIA